MKKNTFRRWGSVVLTAIISTAFLFQNNKMIMRKATIIDLKKTQVVAYTDSPDLEDVGELG